MKFLLRFLPLFSLLFLLGSCAIFRTNDDYRPNEPMAITAKLSGTFVNQDKESSFSGTLRMRRDQVVQLSLTKFGIEGVRLIFTPDSVLLLDRLHKRYLQTSYAALPRAEEGKALSFETVQRFLWNDDKRALYQLSTSLFQFVTIELNIERNKTKRLRGHHIPQHNRLILNVFEKNYVLDLSLSQLKINYDWRVNQRIPAGYEPMALPTLLNSFR